MATRYVQLDFPDDQRPDSLRMLSLTVAATGQPAPGVTLPAAWTVIDVGHGVFRFSFDGDPGTRYAYSATAFYDGIEGPPFDSFINAVGASPVTAAQMVAAIRTALLTTPIGVVTVTVDGQTTTWNRQQAIAELQFWQAEAVKEAGLRPRFVGIDLTRF